MKKWLPSAADLVRLHDVRVVHARREARFVHEHRDELGVVGELLADLLHDDELLDVRGALAARTG